MVFGKKKPRDTLEEDHVRTEDACELASMLQTFLDGLKTRRDQAEDLKAELQEKHVKYKDMLADLGVASATLTKVLDLLETPKVTGKPESKES